jgi:hypothetical protein
MQLFGLVTVSSHNSSILVKAGVEINSIASYYSVTATAAATPVVDDYDDNDTLL